MWGGTVFCYYLRSLHNCFVTESGCSGNDGVGNLFWGIKNLSFCCFLVAIKFFSNFIGKCQCKHAVRFKMKEGRSKQDAVDQSGAAYQNTMTGLL